MSKKLKVKDIVALIEEFAPANLAESYDNTGLLIGSEEKNIEKVLLTVDVTEKVVEEAKNIGADMILSHHPIIFKPLKTLNGNNHIERCVIELIKSDIALYAAHTSIDSAVGGVSYALAQRLGLEKISTLAPVNERGDGFGAVGELPVGIESVDFLEKVKQIVGISAIRHSALVKPTIKRVAMCGGSGSSLLENAKSSGADLYLSADFKYNDFFSAENDIIIADIGHFESEKFVLDIFSEIISKKYPIFAVCKASLDSNPVLYM